MKTSERGLISLCLLALCGLSACAPPPLVRTERYRVTPPALLLNDTPGPEPLAEPASNRDLLLYTQELELALDAANNDKAALRTLFE